jgi:hypothetical protein
MGIGHLVVPLFSLWTSLNYNEFFEKTSELNDSHPLDLPVPLGGFISVWFPCRRRTIHNPSTECRFDSGR